MSETFCVGFDCLVASTLAPNIDEGEGKDSFIVTFTASLCKSTTQNMPPKFFTKRRIGKEN